MGLFDIFEDLVAAENAMTTYQNGIQMANPPAGGSSGGGNGYKFTPDEMQSVLTGWQNLQAKIQVAMNSAAPMTGVSAPGTETASDTAINSVNQSGYAYMDHLNAMYQYAQKYVDALKTALTNYNNAEQSGHSAMTTVQTQL